MKKSDRELALYELNRQNLVENVVEILGILNETLPEGELGERDQLYNACVKFLGAIFSTVEEEWNPQHRMAYKERYPFKYYQNGIIESRKYYWGCTNILLPSWEAKSKKVLDKKARVEEKTSTVSKNKDAIIKRKNVVPKRIYTTPEDIVKLLDKQKMLFYAAQVRKHLGLATPIPEELSKKDLCCMKHKLRADALEQQYKDPLQNCTHYTFEKLLKSDERNSFAYWCKQDIVKRLVTLGYIKKPDYLHPHETLIEAMKDPKIKKLADQHDKYITTIKPILQKEKTAYSNCLSNLDFARLNDEICFLEDAKIDDFINHILDLYPEKQKDLDWYSLKQIIMYRNCSTSLAYSYSIKENNFYDARGSAKEIAEEWGIIPKEVTDDSIAV